MHVHVYHSDTCNIYIDNTISTHTFSKTSEPFLNLYVANSSKWISEGWMTGSSEESDCQHRND